MKKIKLNYSLLIYDIETQLLLAWIWALGEQIIRHDQLFDIFNMFGIITISYKWYHEDKIHTLTGPNAVEEFDKVARTADVILGKNNYRFDDKRLNTERLLKGLPPFPEFMFRSEDLERQMRRYFSFPSMGLDYFSRIFGQGGKKKMEHDDWKAIARYQMLGLFTKELKKRHFGAVGIKQAFCQAIFNNDYCNIVQLGLKALGKMSSYNQKDIKDTEFGFTKIAPYVTLKHNAATKGRPNTTLCITCGSSNIERVKVDNRFKVVTRGTIKRVEFYCLDHKGYAGSRPFVHNSHGHAKYTGPMGK